ncbi:MAG: hypothetical protein AABX75_01045 [Nanoarchaeota archaeon]
MMRAVQRGYQSPLIAQLPAGLHERLASAVDAAIALKIGASVQYMPAFAGTHVDRTGWQVWQGMGFANYAEVYAFTQPGMTLGAAYFFYRRIVGPTALTLINSITREQSLELERALGLEIDARKSIDGLPLGTVNGATLRKVRYPKYGSPGTIHMGLLECKL